MKSRDFVYWLQGFFELIDPDQLSQLEASDPMYRELKLSAKQTDMIRKHLALVFKHEIDPAMGDVKHQEELNKLHAPKLPPIEKLEIGGVDPLNPKILYRC